MVISLSRPALVVVSGWFLAGLTLIADAIADHLGYYIEVNPALRAADLTLRVVLGIMLTLGAVMVGLSTLRWKNKSTAWRLEVGAYPVLIAGWGLYFTSVLLTDGFHLFPMAIGFTFGLACCVRLLEVLAVIRRTRRNVDALPDEVKRHA